MQVYTTPSGFRADAPKAGSKQAQERPLTLSGENIVRHTLTAAAFAEWQGEENADKRAAILEASSKLAMTGGRVQVNTASLADWRSRIIAATDALNAQGLAAHAALVESTPKAERDALAPFEPTTPDVVGLAALAAGVFVVDSAGADETETVIAALFA